MNEQEKALMLASLTLHRVAFGNDNMPPKEELLAAKEHLDALLQDSMKLRADPRYALNGIVDFLHISCPFAAEISYMHFTGHPGATQVTIKLQVNGGQWEYVQGV